MKTNIIPTIIFMPIFLLSMPPRNIHTGPPSCIVGAPRVTVKVLRDYTIETCAILVQFSDNRADTLNNTPARFDSMFYSLDVYQGQYRAGSLNDFFIENSYGVTDVGGGIAGNSWHMSSHTYDYYDDGYYMLTTGYLLARDAVILVDGSVDFSQYDLNNDNRIDGVFVIHAGPGAEDTGDPHMCWSHAIPGFDYTTNDGILIEGATNVPEINLVTPTLDTTLCCIGVMCHELGHIVGLPDLYDGSRNTWGVGYWSLMGYGAWGAGGNTPWSPSHADGWCKMQSGWVTPTAITSNTYGLVIPDLETHPVTYRVWRNGIVNDTFFILENRWNKGFDTPLPGQGLLIWHIDPRFSQYHNVVDLEEADGRDDLDNGWGYRPDPHYYHPELGDAGDPFPGDSNTTVFDSLSYPSSNDNWGGNTDVTVKNIVLNGDTVICDVIINPLAVQETDAKSWLSEFSVQPNPFNRKLTIEYAVCDKQYEETGRDPALRIYDATGRLVKDFSPFTAYGSPSTVLCWDGTDNEGRQLPAGIYWIFLKSSDKMVQKKVLYIR